MPDTPSVDASDLQADLVVVGAGIVGVATALEALRRRPGERVVLVEKEQRVGLHQTGHNSGVIHSGIYYAPGSLKAEFCRQGLAETKAFATEHAIPYDECGKLLVATDDLELSRMRALGERAGRNGLSVTELDRAGLAELEPEVSGLGALLVKETAIIDYRRVSDAMVTDFVRAGGQIVYGLTITSVDERDDAVLLSGPGRSVRAGRVVFCAGLQADRMARLAGLDTDVAIVPFRGEYYTVTPAKRQLVSHLIYPVPDPTLPFLGVHLSPTIGGELTVGPNAVLGLAREGYRKGSVNLADVRELATFPGIWKVARHYLRTGAREMYNSAVKIGYLREVQKYCPALRSADLKPREAGIRAQAVLRDGTLLHDFRIEQTPRTVHVMNAPSPAATSAMPIARHLVGLLAESTA